MPHGFQRLGDFYRRGSGEGNQRSLQPVGSALQPGGVLSFDGIANVSDQPWGIFDEHGGQFAQEVEIAVGTLQRGRYVKSCFSD